MPWGAAPRHTSGRPIRAVLGWLRLEPMTTFGHSLTGIALGVLAIPGGWPRRSAAALLLAFVFLANMPDLPTPGWGHDRYDISHSIFVNAAIIALVMAVLMGWKAAWRRVGGARVVAFGVAAWVSHLLLDSFYNHGNGIAIFWPFSEGRLELSMPWFSTLRGGWAWDAHTARVVAMELAFYIPLVAVALLARWQLSRRSSLPRPSRPPG